MKLKEKIEVSNIKILKDDLKVKENNIDKLLAMGKFFNCFCLELRVFAKLF